MINITHTNNTLLSFTVFTGLLDETTWPGSIHSTISQPAWTRSGSRALSSSSSSSSPSSSITCCWPPLVSIQSPCNHSSSSSSSSLLSSSKAKCLQVLLQYLQWSKCSLDPKKYYAFQVINMFSFFPSTKMIEKIWRSILLCQCKMCRMSFSWPNQYCGCPSETTANRLGITFSADRKDCLQDRRTVPFCWNKTIIQEITGIYSSSPHAILFPERITFSQFPTSLARLRKENPMINTPCLLSILRLHQQSVTVQLLSKQSWLHLSKLPPRAISKSKFGQIWTVAYFLSEICDFLLLDAYCFYLITWYSCVYLHSHLVVNFLSLPHSLRPLVRSVHLPWRSTLVHYAHTTDQLSSPSC